MSLELLSTGTAPCIVATILCLILENWHNSVAGRFSTRNKLVIGCIDRSSANISFVLNSAPYNCLQISWLPIMDPTIANKYYGDLQMDGQHIPSRCSLVKLENVT